MGEYHFQPFRNPSIFTGERNQNPEKWLKEFHRVARYNCWDDSMCLANVYFFLQGTAHRWYENVEEKINSWDIFVKIFSHNFGHHVFQKDQLAENLKTRAQGKEETSDSYIQDVIHLCREVNPAMMENEIVAHLTKGISEEIYQSIIILDIATIDEFIKWCRKIEASNKKNVLPNVAAIDSSYSESMEDLNRRIVREEVLRSLNPESTTPEPSFLKEIIREEIEKNVAAISKPIQRPPPRQSYPNQTRTFNQVPRRHHNEERMNGGRMTTSQYVLIAAAQAMLSDIVENDDNGRRDPKDMHQAPKNLKWPIPTPLQSRKRLSVASSFEGEAAGVKNPPSSTAAKLQQNYVEIIIDDIAFSALVDSGSSFSVISDGLRRQLKKTMFKDSGMTLKVADGRNVTSTGRCTISLSINGLEQPLEFIVLPNSNPSIILGWDFLEASNAVIDCGRADIRLEEAKDVLNSPASMGKFMASRSVVIPAESTKLINVMSIIGKGLTLPYALFRLSHNKGKLWIVNSSTTAQIVPKGMCLGKIQRVEENNLTAISECSEFNKEVKNANHASHADKSDFKFLQNLISDDLSEEQQSQILSILKRYDKIFDKNNEPVKQTSVTKHKIETGSHQPIKHRPYRVSRTERQAIQTEVDKMLDAGIILKKKDGNWRFCLDYRRLNKVTKKDVYPLPRIDVTLDSLKGAKFYSSMDLRSGYWQIEVDEADREKTAFITPDGLYEFLVMPFGLCNAPATFERMMDKILKGLKWTMALCYLDDIVVYSKSFNEHLHRLEIILQCLDKAELRLSPKKCLFGTKRISVWTPRIYPGPEKIEAIAKFPTPKSITDVRSFIGLCSYYRRFIENFAEKAAPLHEVLKKDTKFTWNSDQQDAFDSLKKALMSEPVLAYFEEQLPTELHTDASGYGIGAVLVQINDGKERPVGYASRTLSKAEKNYSTTERECLAAIWAINKFRPYLFGREFVIPPGLLKAIPPATSPFQRVGMDLLGRFPKSDTVCTDYLTLFAVTKALPTGEAKEAAKFLMEDVVLKHGAPREIITDRGRVFQSKLIAELTNQCSSIHRFTTAYHPQTNGLTERLKKTLANMIAMYVSVEQKDWKVFLPYVTFAYNTAKQDTTGFTPFKLIHGREAEITVDTLFPNPHEDLQEDYSQKIASRVEETRQLARLETLKAQEKDKARYDSKHEAIDYNVGDLVWIFIPIRKVGLSEKLMKKYFGPYRVTRKLSDVTFEVEPVNQPTRRRQTRDLVHVLRMKPYHDPEDQADLLVYNKFIPHYAQIRAPLNEILFKNSAGLWSAKHEQAFQTLKNALISKPELYIYDPSKPCHLITDASGLGVAGVLKQPDKQGILHPIAYYSRNLHPYEQNYTASEIETLAIINSVQIFHRYLHNIPFTLHTDHLPLKWIKNMPIATHPNHIFSLDTMGVLHNYETTRNSIHMIVDHHSRFLWAFPTKSVSTDSYITCLKILFQINKPEILITDRNAAFLSNNFKQFLGKNNVKHLLTSAHHPETNAKIERLNSTIINRLRSEYNHNLKFPWTKYIPNITESYNDTVHTITGFTPRFLYYGIQPQYIEHGTETHTPIEKARKLAIEKTIKSHEHSKQLYDIKHPEPIFKGDQVLVKTFIYPNTERNQNPEKWLKEFHRVARYNCWDDSMCLANVYFFLQGTAHRWYENVEEKINSWDIFVKIFSHNFGHHVFQKDQLAENLKTRAQGKEETSDSYIQDVIHLCREVNPAMMENEIVAHLTKGISEEIYQSIIILDIATIDEFIKWCRKIEASNKKNVLPNVAAIDSSYSESMEDLNRRIVREEVLRSLNPESTTPEPSFLKEIIREEIEKNGEAAGVKNPPSSTAAKLQQNYVEIIIDDIAFSALVDSGSSFSVISDGLRRQLKKTMFKDSGMTLKVADGRNVTSTGRCTISLSINGLEQPLEFIVLPNSNPSIILGWDFLEASNAVIDCGRADIRLEEAKDVLNSPASMGKFMASRSVVIPAESTKLINVMRKGLTLPYALFRLSHNKGKLWIVNSSTTAQIVPKGMCLGKIQRVEENNLTAISECSEFNKEVKNANHASHADKSDFKFLQNLISDDLSEEQQSQILSILKRYDKIFDKNNEPVKQTSVTKHKIETGSHQPIKHRPYRVSRTERQAIQTEVDKMLDAGIILKKKDGNWRFCLDYRRLNKVTKKDVYPLPRIDVTLDSLKGAKFYSSMDLRSGYWQIEVDEADREKTAFITPDGLYEFLVMPFGLCNAPATFERMMDKILKGLKWTMALCYLDDIVVYSKSFNEHLHRLEIILQCLDKAELRLSPKKCLFGTKRISIYPGPEKIEAIAKFPTPKSITDVRSFIGLCSYYRRFIENFAEKAAPLHEVLKKDTKFTWNSDQQDAFDSLKKALMSEPVLAYFEEQLPTELHTDASGYGIGAVLVQINDGKERPVGYASRTLSKAEKNYSTTERECLAAIWAINKFRPYLFGREFVIPPGLLKAIPPATSPFQRVGMDLLGRFPKSDTVCTDYLTLFAVTKALPTGEAKEAAKFLMEDVVLKHGAPREIITDRGRVFQSKLIAELTNQCSSIHRFTTAYHPQTNGLTERLKKTLANMIAMYVSVEQKDWKVFLPYVTFAYNTAKQDTTGFTPFKLIHGREAEITVDTLFPNPHEDLQEDYSQKIASRVEETRQLARLETLKAQEKDKARYDSKHEAIDYNVGDLVWIFIPIRKVGLSEKLMKKYFGPYRVTRKLSDVTFEVEPVNQPTRRRQTRDLVHVLRMKPYHDPEDQADLLVYNKFIPHYAQIRAPLNEILFKNSAGLWSAKHEQAFQTLKNALISKPELYIYDPSKPCHLITDASGLGVAGVLKQPDKQGILHPIAYYSRNLHPYEQNYTASEIETLAIINSVQIFHRYLHNIPFTLHTDHLPLKWIKNMPIATHPNHIFSLDTMGVLHNYETTRNSIHMIVDHHSRFLWAFPTKSVSTDSYITCLKILFQINKPEILITDRNAAFLSNNFKQFLGKNNVKHLLTSAHHPETNAKIERLNSTIINRLRSEYNHNLKFPWTKYIPNITESYNDTVHTITGFTPRFLYYGIQPQYIEHGTETHTPIEKARKLAIEKTIKSHEHSKQLYDIKHPEPIFKGDQVLVKTFIYPNTERNQNPEKWLKEFHRVARYNCWDDSMCLANVYFFLQGTAHRWYENVEEKINSWDIFVKIFSHNFGHHVFQKDQLAENLKTRAQGKEETSDSYIQDVIHLCREVNPAMMENEIVAHLTKGISEEIYQSIIILDIATIDEFIKWCRKIEASNKKNVLPNVAAIDSSYSESMEDLNRRIVREEVLRSLNPESTTPEPSFLKEIIREEIEKNGEAAGVKNPPSSTAAKLQQNYVEIIIDDIAFSALVDSGSSFSVISDGLRRQLKKTMFKDSGMTLKVADGRNVTSTGRCTISLSINGLEQPLEFIVLPNSNPSIILGWDFLEASNAVIDCGRADIRLEEAKDVLNSPASMGKFMASRSVVIPAESTKLINVMSIIGKGLTLPYALFRLSHNKGKLWIVNSSTTAQIVPKGMCLGKIQRVEENNLTAISECSEFNKEVKNANHASHADKSDFKFLQNLISDDLSEEQQSQILSILKRYDKIFDKNNEPVKQTSVTKHKIETGSHQPIKHRPYRVSRTERQAIQTEVDKMLDAGIILKKKDGNWRFCLDYRRLNKVTKKDVYPLPRIDVTLDSLKGAKFYSSMDLRSGYWQIEVDEADREKTAFITPDGLYEFLVMPFGLCNAPATFERMMDKILKGLKWTMALCYLDDIVPSYASAQKMFGHLVDSKGIYPGPEKIEAIAKFPTPKSITDVRSFIGLCSYYRRFIENFAEKAAPLHEVLKKDTKFTWNSDQQDAFDSLKKALMSEPVLAYFEEQLPTELHTDASGYGIGAVLVQINDGKERPVGYASRTLSKAEKNYSTTERECLAAIWAINKFRPYLFGREFVIPPGLLKAIPPATSPFQRVGMDLLGRFPKSDTVCTDYLTLFAVTKALPTGEAKEAAKFLMEDVVLKHGAPREIITDRGRVFQSKLIAELTNQCSSIHRFTTAYHPQTNGLTERLNKTLANMIAMYVSVEQKDWKVFLPYVTFAYNTAKQDTTGFTPFKLIHGREAEITVDTLFPNPHEDLQEDYSQKIASRVEETRQLARLETLKAQEKDKARYDSKHEAIDYNVGDLVWIFIPIRKVGLSEKLMKKYFGPYRVTRKLSDVTFEVEPVNQPTRRRQTRDLVHVLRMKPYHDPEDQADLFK
ncbi:hypothetical protein LAZ67_X003197 [Cordylochernes scorpioides]|uniref:Reverse transcriptase n=1 Tax=Cordylochernes scorpioides TaxID=51811 RepID=A0ABY6LWK7_9ARAC|nr:hypothetical protein LAZ67_X003197 [Cordylochernes scorpioides]